MSATLQPRQDILTVLQELGYRSTVPRRAIAHTLEGIHEGLTAEDVGKELPEVGRATIFRTLKLLVEAGVVCRLSLLNGAPRYSLSPIEDHHHTVCVKCGRIGEFRATEFGRLMKGIDRDIIGGIASRCIEINVTCDQCNTDGHR